MIYYYEEISCYRIHNTYFITVQNQGIPIRKYPNMEAPLTSLKGQSQQTRKPPKLNDSPINCIMCSPGKMTNYSGVLIYIFQITQN